MPSIVERDATQKEIEYWLLRKKIERKVKDDTIEPYQTKSKNRPFDPNRDSIELIM